MEGVHDIHSSQVVWWTSPSSSLPLVQRKWVSEYAGPVSFSVLAPVSVFLLAGSAMVNQIAELHMSRLTTLMRTLTDVRKEASVCGTWRGARKASVLRFRSSVMVWWTVLMVVMKARTVVSTLLFYVFKKVSLPSTKRRG
ncbi:hypothetical protein J6590_024441 [Homalodisca vitripennis]|nr:hypothetical protein J6590_024441 [Homalodisca vitripennis]